MNPEGAVAALTIKDIVDIGTIGLLVIANIALWRRMNHVTDQLIAIRQKVDLVAGAVVPVEAPAAPALPTEEVKEQPPPASPIPKGK